MTTPKAATNAAAKRLTDEQIEAAVRPLYANDKVARMGLPDDIRTGRAIESAVLASLAPAGLDSLERWHHNEHDKSVHDDPIGEFVRFADVERWAATNTHYVSNEEAKLYRDLTGDATALGYDGIPAALEALRASHAGAAAEPAEIITDGPAGWRHGLNPPAAAPSSADVRAAAPALAATEREECWSRDEENFNDQSLADLIGNHDDLKPGDTVWVGEAVRPEPKRLIDADDVIEMIGERAYEIAPEYVDNYPDVTEAEKIQLNAMLASWISTACPPTFWEVRNVRAYVLMADDFPASPATDGEKGETK